MHNNKNRINFLLAAGLLLPALLPISAWADDPLTLTKQADISFGTIDFIGSIGSGNVTIGTNGNITYGSNTSGSGIGTPAQLQITGPVGSSVTVSCATTGTIALPSGGVLNLPVVRFNIGAANTGSFATGTECTGIGQTVATHTISSVASENTIFIGASLATDHQSLTSGLYSGTNTGGSLPTFQILAQ